MTNNKNQSPNLLKFIVLLALVLGAIAAYYFHAQRKSPTQATTTLGPKIITDGLISIATEIQKRFEEGDTAGELNINGEACLAELGKLKNIDSLYTRCNPDYLQCFYSGKLGNTKRELSFKYEGKTYQAEILSYTNQKIYKVLSRTLSPGTFLPSFGYEMRLRFKEFPESILTFSMENSCSDVYLPKRKYAYGEEAKSEILEWDNLDANLFVDKFLVSNRDIREWNEAASLKIKFEPDKLAMPATRLSLEEMRNYCAFRGKRLLEAHVFDAARFLPTDMSDTEPIKVKRGPYYWTKETKMTFLHKKDKKLLNPENCHYAYVAECERITPFDPYYASPTWMGVNQALGGMMEVYRNPLFPEKNLKLSSYHFALDSKNHVVGKHDSSEKISEENKQFAFRCMTVSPFIVRENDEENNEKK